VGDGRPVPVTGRAELVRRPWPPRAEWPRSPQRRPRRSRPRGPPLERAHPPGEQLAGRAPAPWRGHCARSDRITGRPSGPQPARLGQRNRLHAPVRQVDPARGSRRARRNASARSQAGRSPRWPGRRYTRRGRPAAGTPGSSVQGPSPPAGGAGAPAPPRPEPCLHSLLRAAPREAASPRGYRWRDQAPQ